MKTYSSQVMFNSFISKKNTASRVGRFSTRNHITNKKNEEFFLENLCTNLKHGSLVQLPCFLKLIKLTE